MGSSVSSVAGSVAHAPSETSRMQRFRFMGSPSTHDRDRSQTSVSYNLQSVEVEPIPVLAEEEADERRLPEGEQVPHEARGERAEAVGGERLRRGQLQAER